MQYHVILCKFEVGFYNQYMHLERAGEKTDTTKKDHNYEIFSRNTGAAEFWIGNITKCGIQAAKE